MPWSHAFTAALLLAALPLPALAEDARIITPGDEVTRTVEHGVTILAPTPAPAPAPAPSPAPRVTQTVVPVPVIVPVPQQQAATPRPAPRPAASEAGGQRRGLGAYVR